MVMTSRNTSTARSSPGSKSDLLFQHILVPTDLTKRAERSLQLAGTFASRGPARVTLLHVIEVVEGLPFEELRPFYDRMERKALATMNTFARRTVNPPASAASAVTYGLRAEEIVKFAVANGVDLIVLASHRVNPSMVNRDWGTISYKVGILAQCPVLLVK
jgi:nucleotide-binding universal stress UspA family protein